MLRRTFLVTLGLVNWGRERARAVTDELIARGRVEASRRDGWLGEVLDAMERRGAPTGTPRVARVRRRLGHALDALPLATKDDLKALEERLRAELTPKTRGGNGPA